MFALCNTVHLGDTTHYCLAIIYLRIQHALHAYNAIAVGDIEEHMEN